MRSRIPPKDAGATVGIRRPSLVGPLVTILVLQGLFLGGALTPRFLPLWRAPSLIGGDQALLQVVRWRHSVARLQADPRLGAKGPPIFLRTIEGRSITPSAIRGKRTVLVFATDDSG